MTSCQIRPIIIQLYMQECKSVLRILRRISQGLRLLLKKTRYRAENRAVKIIFAKPLDKVYIQCYNVYIGYTHYNRAAQSGHCAARKLEIRNEKLEIAVVRFADDSKSIIFLPAKI